VTTGNFCDDRTPGQTLSDDLRLQLVRPAPLPRARINLDPRGPTALWVVRLVVHSEHRKNHGSRLHRHRNERPRYHKGLGTSLTVQPPIGKQKRYPALDLTVIQATARDAPKGRKLIDWKLVTDLPARTRAEVIEKIDWYALHWKIEVFHKILRSGCGAEASKLRTHSLKQ
jgi:hypothetical protein